MNNKILLYYTLGSTLFIGKTDATTLRKDKKPNVILIMADDLGWGDVGFNGSPIVKTPNLDKLAAKSALFSRFYAACAVSSPTRASVLTGRNPYRTGVFTANCGILRPEELTIPEILKEKGYTTGHFGKWHLGTLTVKEKDANRGRVDNYRDYNPPKQHGYDVGFVSESKVPTWDPMKKPADLKKTFSNSYHEGWNYLQEGEKSISFGTYYWDINGNKITNNLDGDDSRVIMDRVIPFIDKNKENPFLAVVWFHAPHLPVVAGPKYTAMYEGHSDFEKNYWGCITAMDQQVGRLVKELEKQGILENTIICFCSDNGPEESTPGSTGIYRERKRSLHEGGVRVPSFIYYPKLIKEGFVTDFPAVTCDYLPTIASIVGYDTNKIPYALDGINLVPFFKHHNLKRKLPIVTAYTNQISLNGIRYKVYYKDGNYVYYDIIKDPTESHPIEETNVLKNLRIKMNLRLEEYKKSFDGNEYGTKSFDKEKQIWRNPKDFKGHKYYRQQEKLKQIIFQ